MLDLDHRTLAVENTQVVVKGHATDSDGKTEGSRRTISLDPFTVAALRQHVEMIDSERETFGVNYPNHGKLTCFADGRRPHPDTVTSRFNRLVDQAGVRRIRPHDVRHTYATLPEGRGVASDATFGTSREHALPAAQHAALGALGRPERRAAAVTWDFMIRLDLMQR